MSTSIFSTLKRTARGLWWLLDTSRRALMNLLLLALMVGAAWVVLRPSAPALKDKTALVLDLAGPLAEQRSGGARDTALKQLRQEGTGQTRLRDLLAVLDAATAEPKITHAVLMLDDFSGAGLPTLREFTAALQRFKAAGKPVYAWGASYTQRQYFVAAHATEVWLDPMGAVFIEGLGRQRNYYKDLFDRVGVSPNVLRVGKYKNAGEIFSANAPSKETVEADALLYGALWASWTGGVEAARQLPAGSVARGLDALPGSLVAAGGNAAKLALESKLVDGLKTRQQAREMLIAHGAKSSDGKTYAQVSFGSYLARLKPRHDGDAIGVVVAEGGISDGKAPAGRIGGLSTAELVRQAREDEHVKAVVLRVNSPGGSAYGSELVRRELELTRQAGKPVVVSMGDVAASGGYWISMASDEIIADEATITGSIGVIAMLPTVQGALDKIGLRTGGYTTSWLTNGYDVRRALDPRFATLVQSVIDHIYADFTGLAAATRKTTADKIDAVGQGRVWTGTQASERGLIDRTGSFDDALKAAAARGKLAEGWRVQYIEREPGRLERLLAIVGPALPGVVAALGLPADLGAVLAGVPPAVAEQLHEELGWLADAADPSRPFAAVVHCLCTAP